MMPPVSSSDRVSCVEIDLDAVRANCRALAARSGARVLAVLKADAYGHGAVQVARTLDREAVCERLVVARLDEALELREAAIEKSVTVLQCFPASHPARGRYELADVLVANALIVVVSSLDDLRCWLELGAEGRKLPSLELEIDTGMARSGIAPDDLDKALDLLAQMAPGLSGFMSHLADADVAGSELTKAQMELFRAGSRQVCRWSREQGRPLPELHLANSCGVLSGEGEQDGVKARAGGALFGLDLGRALAAPVDESTAARDSAEEARIALQPVMRVCSRLVATRLIRAGETVGYNQTWRAPTERFVGLVPVGYGDGYPRSCSGARVLIGARGRPAKVVGRISMDSIVIDLEEFRDDLPSIGERVCLLGRCGDETIGADELARHAGTISYEITCRFASRLPRVVLGSSD